MSKSSRIQIEAITTGDSWNSSTATLDALYLRLVHQNSNDKAKPSGDGSVKDFQNLCKKRKQDSKGFHRVFLSHDRKRRVLSVSLAPHCIALLCTVLYCLSFVVLLFICSFLIFSPRATSTIKSESESEFGQWRSFHMLNMLIKQD